MIIYVYILDGGVCVQLLGGQGARARVLVLLECSWNLPEPIGRDEVEVRVGKLRNGSPHVRMRSQEK